jgi:hypothetical protein
LPGGSFYEEVNPWVYSWLYYSYAQEEEESQKFAKDLALFQGSFANPEMAKSILKSENPTAEMEDEQFEAVSEYILDENKKKETKLRKRQRKLLLNQQNNKR